jgi:hypothetical protein
MSMDWFKGKFTGNHRFSHEIWGFPVGFPLNQSIENGSFLSHRGYPQSSYVIHLCGDFPRKKPSSELGDPP